MNTERLFSIAVLSCLSLLSCSTLAQSTYRVGLLPTLNLNGSMNDKWSYNLRLQSRQQLRAGEFDGIADKNYQYLLTDLDFVAAKKVGLNSRIVGGYLIRFAQAGQYHRAIQQFTIIKRMSNFRLAHRFRTDQTFSSLESPEYRLRYRLGSEFPFNGSSVDPKEFYLKLNNEYVNSWQSSNYNLEIRLIPLLGHDLSGSSKMELGLDYRVNSFIINKASNSMWFCMNWFHKLN